MPRLPHAECVGNTASVLENEVGEHSELGTTTLSECFRKCKWWVRDLVL